MGFSKLAECFDADRILKNQLQAAAGTQLDPEAFSARRS
jgi:hypothetical protein